MFTKEGVDQSVYKLQMAFGYDVTIKLDHRNNTWCTVELSLNLTLARMELAFISVTFFWKLVCGLSASDNTRENMHTN